jgi:hypothetical protein
MSMLTVADWFRKLYRPVDQRVDEPTANVFVDKAKVAESGVEGGGSERQIRFVHDVAEALCERRTQSALHR